MLKENEILNKKEVKIDKIISVALMSSFVVLTFQYLILVSFNLIGTSSASLVQIVSKIMVGLIFAVALPYVLKRSLKLFFLLYGFGILVFSYHFLVFPENHPYLLNIIFPFFFTALPSFIYVLSIKDLKVFVKVTEKAAVPIFIFGTVLGILIFTGKTSAGVYSMALSYYMLLPAIIFLGKIFDKRKLIYIILFLISSLIIVALGSRGALLCIIVYAILRVLSPRQKISFSKVLVSGIVVSALILFVSIYDKILISLNELFLDYGIHSRTISLLLRDELYLSGRDSIVKTVWNEVIQSPFLGIGLAGDLRINNGSYVHNFIIEVIGNYGIPIGILLLGILLLILFNGLYFSENYNLISLWISVGLVHLMISGSYIIDIKFWIFLGILFNIIGKRMNSRKTWVKKNE